MKFLAAPLRSIRLISFQDICRSEKRGRYCNKTWCNDDDDGTVTDHEDPRYNIAGGHSTVVWGIVNYHIKRHVGLTRSDCQLDSFCQCTTVTTTT